jgi:hypothetical protein
VNVTGDDLRAYIEVFHQALAATASEHLPPGQERSLLRHAALLPASIKAYVSSTFGVAIEYEPAARMGIQVKDGTERIEDLLLGSPAWSRELAPLYTIDGAYRSLRRRPLTRGFPFRLASEKSSLTLQEVVVQIGPWKRLVAYAEVYGTRDAAEWTVEKAHARATMEVLLALIHLKNAGERELTVGEYLAQYRDKVVLLFGGEDAAGSARLETIADAMRALQYEPVTMADIPPEPEHDPWEAMRAIGANARFAVIDASSESNRHLALCREQGWLAAPLAAAGMNASAFGPAEPGDTVLPPTAYEPADPGTAVLQALRRLEAAREEAEGRMRG